jgi:hypothetical protein
MRSPVHWKPLSRTRFQIAYPPAAQIPHNRITCLTCRLWSFEQGLIYMDALIARPQHPKRIAIRRLLGD